MALRTELDILRCRYELISKFVMLEESIIMEEKLNFTVGPVMSSDSVLEMGSHQVPYFRTPEFSAVMLENEAMIKEFAHAAEDSRAVFLTGSGTAAMEAMVMNMLSKDDNVIVVNGGSFGHRFVELLTLHNIPFSEIKLKTGQNLKKEMLAEYENKGYTAFLVNIHETSTGVHYDLNMISKFCKRNGLFLMVDAISSFLADEIHFQQEGIGAMITGSQKALACPPGVSVVLMSPAAIERIERNPIKSMYLDLKSALKNGERGQTPFTPAVGVLLQINCRLKEIKSKGGAEAEIAKVREIAEDFRSRIKDLPFEIVSESLSNAVTPLHCKTASAYDIFSILKDEYGIWICPNGGELKDSVFRVGHIGNLRKEDNTKLIEAFEDLRRRCII